MSSFICSPKHFNSIQHSIQDLLWSNSFRFPYSFKDRFPFIYDHKRCSDEKASHQLSEVMDTIRELNVVCVSLQYKNEYKGSLDQEIKEQLEYVKTTLDYESLNNVGLYKSLQCLNYQIETHHLRELRELTPEEENALFFINELKTHLAHEIVTGLDSYDKAKWSID